MLPEVSLDLTPSSGLPGWGSRGHFPKKICGLGDGSGLGPGGREIHYSGSTIKHFDVHVLLLEEAAQTFTDPHDPSAPEPTNLAIRRRCLVIPPTSPNKALSGQTSRGLAPPQKTKSEDRFSLGAAGRAGRLGRRAGGRSGSWEFVGSG